MFASLLLCCLGDITKRASMIFPSLTISPKVSRHSVNLAKSLSHVPVFASMSLYFHTVFSSGMSSTFSISKNSRKLILSLTWYSICLSLSP